MFALTVNAADLDILARMSEGHDGRNISMYDVEF